MNHYVDAFLKEVLGQIRYKKAHPYLAQELNDHIELFKEELVAEGLSEDEAYKRAIEQMGEPAKIGKGLHKLHKPKMEWGILLLFIALIGIGLLAIGTYSNQVSDYGFLLEKQSRFVILGAIAFSLAYFMDYRKLEKFSTFIYIAGIIILLITLTMGISMNGAKRWIAIGGFSIQATNIAIPLFIIGFVGFVRKWANKGILGYSVLSIVAIVPTFICMMSQILDGIYVAISLIGIFILYVISPAFKGNRRRIGMFLITAVSAVTGVMVYFILSKEHRIGRLMAWLRPEIDPSGAGYMPINIRQIIHGAGWFGNREMLFTITSEGVHLRIPDGSTDLIFTFIIGMMGWIVAIEMMIVIGAILLRCFKLASKARDEYGKFLLYGISILFATQYILGILMNIGISPIGGSLPFISYGGSKLLFDMALMGLFLGIYRRKDIIVYELLDISKI